MLQNACLLVSASIQPRASPPNSVIIFHHPLVLEQHISYEGPYFSVAGDTAEANVRGHEATDRVSAFLVGLPRAAIPYYTDASLSSFPRFVAIVQRENTFSWNGNQFRISDTET